MQISETNFNLIGLNIFLRKQLKESKPVHLLHGNNKRPPLHVHLSDTTPLHVHVDKPSKPVKQLRHFYVKLFQNHSSNLIFCSQTF